MIPETRPVLVVDDHPAVRAVVREYFVSLGEAVVEAEDGLEALLTVKRHRPWLIILDLLMPRLGGAEAIRHIQRFDRSIEIAVLSGHLTSELADELEGRGVLVLRKPIELVALGNLHNHLRARHVRTSPQGGGQPLSADTYQTVPECC